MNFNFKALEKEINYLAMWPDYIDQNREFLNFEKEDKNGCISIDDCPMSIGELEKKGHKYYGSTYHCHSEYGTEKDELEFEYFFRPSSNEIEIMGDKFSMKECLVIINMVMEQLKYGKHAYYICYGFNGDSELQFVHQDAAHSGWWWINFMRCFEGRIDDIKYVNLSLEVEEYDEGKRPTVYIILDNENPYKNEKEETA